MHPVVPALILNHFSAGEYRGDYPAVGLFLDISGFSTMTEALMAHDQDGAEALASIMRSVMDPIIESVFVQGGFVAYSAGDSITALFPLDAPGPPADLRALAAGWNIQQHMLAHTSYPTRYQVFQVSAKVGLGMGEVHWGILRSVVNQSAVYYFQGSAIDRCVSAEHHARAGEIILDESFYTRLKAVLQGEPLGEVYRLMQVHTALPPPQPVPDPELDDRLQAHFYPKNILTQATSGEFRQVVSLFIRLPTVRTETQLERFIQSLFHLQEKYGGFLNRLDFGDKGTHLLMFWGAPAANENDIGRAMNFILELQVITSIPISAGVTYRISHAGFIGGRQHVEYTCFGQGVNLAARLMTAAPRGGIWVDEFIAQHAAQRFEIDFMDQIQFKGFAQPQKVFVLLERKKEEQPFFQGVIAGREADLAKLHQFILPIFQQRRPAMLVVTGEPGIGKSRLVHDFVEGLQQAGQVPCQLFLGQTDEIVRQPLNPLKYWLRQYFGIAELQGEARNKRSFNHRLDELIEATSEGELAEELDRTRSCIGALVGLHWPDSLYEELDSPGRYENTIFALVALLRAESLRLPAILLLEDIHWLDSDSRAFLIRLASALKQDENQPFPLAVLATSRYLPRDIGFAEEIFSVLPLASLDRAGMKTLALNHLDAPPGPGLLALLEQRAEGNPFYAEQILRFLKEGNGMALERGAWTVKPGWVDALPVDVNVLLVARLDHLTQRVKEAVQTAAVLGREFEVRLLSFMLYKKDDGLLPEVAQAEREAIWIALSELRCIFKHTLMRDAAYRMQVNARRIELHALALEGYETLYQESLSEHYAELAYHAEMAGLDEKARHYLEQAGIAALEAYQNEKALDYINRALDRTPPDDIHTRYVLLDKRDTIYYYLGRSTERERNLKALEALLPFSNDERMTADINLIQTRQALDIGQFAQSYKYAGQAANLAQSIGDLEKAAVAMRHMASAMMRQGRYEPAADLVEQSIRLAGQAGSQAEKSRSLNILGMLRIDQGKLDEGRDAFRECLAITRQAGNFRLQGAVLNNLGWTAANQWNYSEARDYFQQALETAQKTGDRPGEAISLGNLGFIAGSLGDFAYARRITERHLRICREVGDPYHEANALVNLSAWTAALREEEAAVNIAREARRVSQKIGARSEEAWALTYLGHVLCTMGKLEEAQQAYEEATAIRSELSQPELACEPAAGLARAAMQQADLPGAVRAITPVLAHLAGGGGLQGTDQPLRVYLTCYQVLSQASDSRARSFLETAYHLLLERAAKITDEAARQSFLTRIDYHRAIQVAYASPG
jgi:predicted ATPase/class 3 adenylate cyclase